MRQLDKFHDENAPSSLCTISRSTDRGELVASPRGWPKVYRRSPIEVVDGRRLRSFRTRQRIVESFLALLMQGNPTPTVAQIAKNAGCSVRSVFERFPRVNDIRVASADYAFDQNVVPTLLLNVDANRRTRIESDVRSRGATCERLLPLWRVLLYAERRSLELRARVLHARRMARAQLELSYASELSRLAAVDREQVLVALEALTDVESWALMREYHRMSIAASRNVWVRAIDHMLPPTPPKRRRLLNNVGASSDAGILERQRNSMKDQA